MRQRPYRFPHVHFSKKDVELIASMTRSVREAKKYAEFRQAFNMTIGHLPMVAGQLAGLEHAARRTTAGAFKLYRDFLTFGGGGGGKRAGSGRIRAARKKRFDIRELIKLQKMTASWDSTDVIRGAMSIFGGHGVMEDFSSLPRPYRDAAINELWEGPRNVLQTQVHRDLQQAMAWYNPSEFVRSILNGLDETRIREFSGEIKDQLAHPHFFQMDEKTIEICRQWDGFCGRFFHAYQDLALQEVENGGCTV